ncbi:MAG: hypothetical protein ACLTBD_08235 [Clostridia bacterium]
MIKEGADYALVELIFEVKSEDTIRRLQEMDIFPEDSIVIMSRKMAGKCYRMTRVYPQQKSKGGTTFN